MELNLLSLKGMLRQIFNELFLLNLAVLTGKKKYFYHFIYYSHEVFISLAMLRNFHFFCNA